MTGTMALFAAEAIPIQRVNLDATSLLWFQIALGAYLIGLLVLSLFAAKKVESQEDYLVAGRKLPLFMCWGTLIATWFGAASMTAASEAAREAGLRGVILDPFACAGTLVLAGLFFAAPMWRMKLLTTGDFFRRTYGKPAELVASCIQVPAYFGWIALQYKALGELQAIYFGIPVEYGILIACGITLAYTMIGGMWSVTLTDTLQIVVAFFGLLVLAYTVYSRFGDGSAFTGIDRMVAQSDPSFITLWPEAMSVAVLGYIGAWSTGLFGNIPGQDLQQRIFSAKDEKTAGQACILAGVLYLLFGMIPVSIGLISRLTHPGDKTGILQLMASEYLSPALAIVFVISFVSIVVSTATSAVLAPATILGHNLLGQVPFFRNRGLILDRVCVVLISMGGLILAYSGQDKMALLDLALSMQLVAMFVPMWLGLYGRPKHQLSAILPMVLGIGFFLLRWLPENVFLAQPEEFVFPAGAAGENYGDYLATLYPAYGGILRDLCTIPADIYGVGAAILGYMFAQWLYEKREPINIQTLKDAWGDDWDRFVSP